MALSSEAYRPVLPSNNLAIHEGERRFPVQHIHVSAFSVMARSEIFFALAWQVSSIYGVTALTLVTSLGTTGSSGVANPFVVTDS
jgi:hypothetical protein